MYSRALVALSGGVDSSAALAMALERFSGVRAAYVDISGEGPPFHATAVARRLGVELETVDAAGLFRDSVREWADGMLSDGMTPNPCARCNARVKLPVLHERLARSEVLITGHYARMEDGRLKRGLDGSKDQSYFLSMVDRHVIRRCIFPVGTMKKSSVRERALELELPFRPMESQDLCFETSARGRPGDIVDLKGRKLGEHSGVENFTVGQRKGLGAFGERMYVIAIDPVEGRVSVGPRDELKASGCTVTDMNWLLDPPEAAFTAMVQTRYRRRPSRAAVSIDGDELLIRFDREEEAVAPGQVCALYQESSVIGGGLITSTYRTGWNMT